MNENTAITVGVVSAVTLLIVFILTLTYMRLECYKILQNKPAAEIKVVCG